jgi:tripartite-type tricarboxylate transporter receptor subunit TctC
MYKNVPFNAMTDFAPITLAAYGSLVLAANPKSGIESVPQLIERAKANPGKLSYATPGVKNVPHLTGELFKSTAGIDMQHISYRANTQAVTDTMTGVVDLVIDGVPALMPQIAAGNLVALGVTSAHKLPGLETLPLVSETLPGFAISGWFAVLAPKGVPPAVLQRVNRDVQGALELEELVARMKDFGVYVDRANRTPEQLAAYLRQQNEMFGKVASVAKIEKD